MMSKEQKQALLDSAISKITSRKLMVWIVATYLLMTGSLEASDWVTFSGIYIGSQSVIDILNSRR